MSSDLIGFIREIYGEGSISLHEPKFDERDKDHLSQTIDSTYVSSVGPLVGEFEKKICEFTGSKYSVAVVNGTAALHVSLLLSGVKQNDEVITQALTFVASTNAIHQCNAKPIFIDVDKKSMGMSPDSLRKFLEQNCEIRGSKCLNKESGRIIKASLPMHTFGFPCEISKIKSICDEFKINLVEDAAESIGSFYHSKHTGLFGEFGILSFNGNKIITTGAGGMILTNNEEFANKARHISSTAKIPHKWNFDHDIAAFNYRMPNINASLGITQIEKLPSFLESKRDIARRYIEWGSINGYHFHQESEGTISNYWLNTIITKDKNQRDTLLKDTNASGIMTRPVWTPMHLLPFNSSFQKDELKNTIWLSDRIVNIPSSPINV